MELVEYSEWDTYPRPVDYNAIWGSISDLEIVHDLRNQNPDSKINMLLYTPSVGAGNPADWDWYIFLKN